MKTTVEIPDALIQEAKELAKTHHTSLRALIELGLQIELNDLRKLESFGLKECNANIRTAGTQPPESF
jgi:hypothetical protein